jgi:hypothetical protein
MKHKFLKHTYMAFKYCPILIWYMLHTMKIQTNEKTHDFAIWKKWENDILNKLNFYSLSYNIGAHNLHLLFCNMKKRARK